MGRDPVADALAGFPDVRVLTEDAVGSLRLPWDGRFSISELRQIARTAPALSVWNQRTGEYIVGGNWRHRTEIATVLELGATGQAVVLLQAFAEVCRAEGMRLVVSSEQDERRRADFYAAASLDLLEEIIVYELPRVRAQPPVLRGMRFEPFDPLNESQFQELLALDHDAFPWMWWNSAEEFLQYYGAPGVSIELGRDADGRAVAYVGTTRFRTWGHLDRIAVASDMQGHGYGRAALDHAVMSLARAGSKRVGLSTQAKNHRSRRLYDAYGFRRASSHDYRIYGRWLEPAGNVSGDGDEDRHG